MQHDAVGRSVAQYGAIWRSWLLQPARNQANVHGASSGVSSLEKVGHCNLSQVFLRQLQAIHRRDEGVGPTSSHKLGAVLEIPQLGRGGEFQGRKRTELRDVTGCYRLAA